MPLAHHPRIGVLRGGPSPEYEVSLRTGANILANLPESCTPIDIFIARDGTWHVGGLPKEPHRLLPGLDLVINGLHGTYGEDGQVQKILESFRVPYTGSSAIASALAMNKMAAKKIYREHGLKTPTATHIAFENLSRQAIREAYEAIPSPFIVKPSASGSSVGVYIAKSLPELEEAVVAAAQYSPAVIIEEYILGKEGTVGVIDDFRNQKHYSLLPIEIRHQGLFDFKSKYTNTTEQICPGNFTQAESANLQAMALAAHRALGLRHYSRSDFIVHPKRGIYILETNTLPELAQTSLLPKALSAVGSNIKEFLTHLIHQTLGKNI